jgi:hypothetical protein
LIAEEEAGNLSTLQLVDLISHKLAMQGPVPPDIAMLRRRRNSRIRHETPSRN